MNGTKLPSEIAKLGSSKEITLFIDGDRGGRLIAQNVIGNARISWVAIAPDGKEVEELTGKEILISLRKKISAEEFLNKIGNNNGNGKNEAEFAEKSKENQAIPIVIKESLKKAYETIKGSKDALLLDNALDVIRRVNAKEVSRAILSLRREVFAVIIDGTATSGIIKACEEKGINNLAASNFGSVGDTKVNLISL